MFELVCLYDFGGQGSSHPELFYKKGFVKIFAKFTVKHLCWSLFFQKQPLEVFCKNRCSQKFRKTYRKTPVPESPFQLQASGLQTLLKKRLWRECFPVNFTKSLKATFLQSHLDDCFRFFFKLTQRGKRERLQYRYFHVSFAKFIRTLNLKNVCGRLL